jgi:hypothetical protein
MQPIILACVVMSLKLLDAMSYLTSLVGYYFSMLALCAVYSLYLASVVL